MDLPWASTASREEIGRQIARWRLHRHLLTDPAPGAQRPATPEQVVTEMLCVQAENVAQSIYAVATRTARPDDAAMRAALAAGTVVRTHVLRPTWHYAHADDIHWLLEITRPRVLAALDGARRASGLTDDVLARADDVLTGTLRGTALDRDALRAALSDAGVPTAGLGLMAVLQAAEIHGLIVSGPPQGDVHTYALLAERVPERRGPVEREAMLAELARRYLHRHGPATVDDLRYWASLTVRDARAAIAANAADLETFTVDGQVFHHPRGTVPGPRDGTAPRGHLLQILDEVYRGYQDSRWVLAADGAVAVMGERTPLGLALVDGQIVGPMSRTVRGGRVEYAVEVRRPLPDGGRDALAAAADRAAAFLGREGVLTLCGGAA